MEINRRHYFRSDLRTLERRLGLQKHWHKLPQNCSDWKLWTVLTDVHTMYMVTLQVLFCFSLSPLPHTHTHTHTHTKLLYCSKNDSGWKYTLPVLLTFQGLVTVATAFFCKWKIFGIRGEDIVCDRWFSKIPFWCFKVRSLCCLKMSGSDYPVAFHHTPEEQKLPSLLLLTKSPEYDTFLKTFISYCSTVRSLWLHQQPTIQTEEWSDEKILTVRQLAMLAISPGGFPRSINCLPTIRLYANDKNAVGPKISWRWRTLWTNGATGFASWDALASSSSTGEWTCFAVTRVKPSSVSASIKQHSVCQIKSIRLQYY